MRLASLTLVLISTVSLWAGQQRPQVHLWLEPEWFDGVQGAFAYWTGAAKPTGAWGVAGPGISAEWTQGGESEWNSMGVPAEETKAECHRDLIVPRAGAYKVWVRYVDHRRKTEPFRVRIDQAGKAVLNAELGIQPVVPPNDEYQLFWGSSFGWGGLDAKLEEGPARLRLIIDKAGEAWRQVDAVLITDDPKFVPVGREKPAFEYQKSFALQPKDGAAWRGSGKDLPLGKDWNRTKLAARDFSMWTGVEADPKWWAKQDLAKLKPYDVFFQFSPPADIRDKFHKQFAGKKDVPIMSFPQLLPGFYLGNSPDLSPESPVRQWLERSKTPFFIMTNYASGNYNEKNGPATYAALTGPLADQFLGYIHGEAIGTTGIGFPEAAPPKSRRAFADQLIKQWRAQQAEAWSKSYKTKVGEDHWNKGISCLSVDSISLAHLFHESGVKTVGYEIDATNVHVPMRIAFERGAARQYGHAWINYASGNFGDACNYFSQNPQVPRGAGHAWFHSKYSETDGVSIAWYRKLYYLNYMGGASAIYWEQNLANQWMLPGPGTHPIQLSPFGRATEDFQSFASRLPDRGEPYTPIGILLSYGHGYERVNYRCKMLHHYPEDVNDRELRELFNICWHPAAVVEGLPAAPDVQSMPSGIYGDIFDVLVDRPAKARSIFNYPVIWAAGDVDLSGPWQPVLDEYVKKGGTLVVNFTACREWPATLTGIAVKGTTSLAKEWSPDGQEVRPAIPYGVVGTELKGAKVLAWAGPKVPLITRHQVGQGAVIVTLIPNLVGLDERAHPAIPYLMNALTDGLLPVEVRLADGQRPQGEIMYQMNKTKDGWLVSLINNRGIDKTQTGIARVDRRAFSDVVLRTKLPIKSAKEWTEPRDLALQNQGEWREIRIRVHPGDVQVVEIRWR
ncbi:MAG: hypothetical protein HY040_00615 [Planctomycetes bacterium]|nr:hypothetical protein [Planctomycetota bacterium]